MWCTRLTMVHYTPIWKKMTMHCVSWRSLLSSFPSPTQWALLQPHRCWEPRLWWVNSSFFGLLPAVVSAASKLRNSFLKILVRKKQVKPTSKLFGSKRFEATQIIEQELFKVEGESTNKPRSICHSEKGSSIEKEKSWPCTSSFIS